MFTLFRRINPTNSFNRIHLLPQLMYAKPRFFSNRDYYDILGVNKTASDSDLKKSYFKLVKKYHPDQNPSPQAKEKFQEISNAYDVLRKPEKRKAYDMYGQNADNINSSSGFGFNTGDQNYQYSYDNMQGEKFFSDVFSNFFKPKSKKFKFNSTAKRGRDIQQSVPLTFAEAVKGCKKEFIIRRNAPCKKCNNSGIKPGTEYKKCRDCKGEGVITRNSGPMIIQTTCMFCEGTGKRLKSCFDCEGKGYIKENKKLNIVIPEGVDNGTTIKVSSQGHTGINGGARGDIFLTAEVEPDNNFERNGADVHYTLEINFDEAILGTKKYIPTLHGDIKLKIKPGTQNGEVVRISGKGIRVLNRTRYGDQYVHFKILIPKKLSDKQRRLINKFKEVDCDDKDNVKNGVKNKSKDVAENKNGDDLNGLKNGEDKNGVKNGEDKNGVKNKDKNGDDKEGKNNKLNKSEGKNRKGLFQSILRRL